MQQTDLNQAIERGFLALQQNRPQEAFEIFTAIWPERQDTQLLRLGVAASACAVKEFATGLRAVDQYLAEDGTHLIAMVLRGDAFKGLGEQRRAIAAYMLALQSVPPNSQPDQATMSALKRAQAECGQAAGLYESYLRDHISKDLGSAIGADGTRSGLALDIVFGKKQIYHQQPNRFYFPELPQRQFYDRTEFDWAKDLEAQTESIKPEFIELAEEENRFGAYVTPNGREPHLQHHSLTNNRDWSAIHLIHNGEPNADNIKRCPKTMAALDYAPIPHVKSHSPSALFSRLLPGAHIPPHTGLFNTRLICHLPIILPGQCTLRVGNQTREWTDGELLIFDDTIEHEAKNASRAPRSVLIFDIWRPELTAEDRALVTSIFEGIAAFGA